jgi:hypothetical protein
VTVEFSRSVEQSSDLVEFSRSVEQSSDLVEFSHSVEQSSDLVEFSRTSGKEILIACRLKIYYRVERSSPVDPVPNHMISVHFSISYFS